jgi:tetratricopeptide (TPR) repeat protein/predicted Ser/Thr protein kinase
MCPGDGGVAAPERAGDAGPRPAIPGFELGDVLGVGGAGAVWAARGGGRDAAVKVATASSQLWRARFASEASALAAIGTPHAPRLFARDVLPDGRAWIAMERIAGASLAGELADMPAPPSLETARSLADAVLAAVDAAHGRGLVHRDLKPENVVISPARAATLIDFGLATIGPTAPIEPAGWAMGTLGYMAPEVLAGGPGDARADVYAIGAILYELFTLRPPFAGEAAELQRAHLTVRPPPPGLLAAIPRALDELILACLAKDPERRPPDAVAVRGALAACMSGATPARGGGIAPDIATDAHPGDAVEGADGRTGDAPASTRDDAPPADTPASTRDDAPTAGSPASTRDDAGGDGPPRARTRTSGASAPDPTGGAAVASELVALAWLDCEAGPARLAAEIARTPGVVVRQHGRTCLALFAAARCEQPARAALSAATRLLASLGGRAALHVDRVDLRRGVRPVAYGEPIDRPEAWLPVEPWTGLLLTSYLVDAIGDLAVVPAGFPGFFAMAGAPAAAAPPLVGRADVVAALTDSARAGFAASRPGLSLLLGAPGSGKSRLLAEIAAAAGELGAAHILIDAARAAERLDGEALRERAREGPLAVLVDDAHLADDAFLDAIEYATLGGGDVPLWVLAAADGPALDQIRPRFGERAARTERLELQPVDDDAMRELAASLLFPADYLPAAVLDRLAHLAGGNPGLLSELVRALKREGAVRPRPDRRSHELAVEAIERLPATAAGRWEASRALDALPAELAASARVAAAFGPVIDEGELDAVEDALERDGEGSFFDAGVALRALASRGMVVDRGGGSWAFASPLVQDAIYQAIPAAERGRIHEHALRYWRGRSGARALAAVARHAGRAGAHAEAVVAALSLAESATAASRYVEAERWYSVALLHVSDTATRVRALVGRGRVRYRLDRGPESLSDLAAARALSQQLGDRAGAASILLDEAMVLDWCGDIEGSAACAERARPTVDAAGDPALSARLLVATGRSLWRDERPAEALELLTDGAAAALDVETRLIAQLLRGSVLAWLGRLDEAEATFAEAENLARTHDDRLHLCAVHSNRIIYWIAREDSARLADDLRRAVQLARELGHPHLERAATHNLAEILHLEGRDADALPLAIRSFELQQRFEARLVPDDALLLCRIAVGLRDLDAASRHLAWVEAHAPSAGSPLAYRLFHRALLLLQQGGSPEAWDSVVTDASGVLPVEFLEILYLRALAELSQGQKAAARGTLAAARTYVDRFPAWKARFDGLAAGTAAWGNMQQHPSEPTRKASISSS